MEESSSRSTFAMLSDKAESIVSMYYKSVIKQALKSKDIKELHAATKSEFVLKEPNAVYSNGNQFERIIFAVETALTQLEEEHKRIIINEYFKKSNNLWWANFFSRSTYYRLKRLALTEFVSYFE